MSTQAISSTNPAGASRTKRRAADGATRRSAVAWQMRAGTRQLGNCSNTTRAEASMCCTMRGVIEVWISGSRFLAATTSGSDEAQASM